MSDYLNDFWIRLTGDIVSAFIVIGAIGQVLPVVTTILAIIWYGIQIWQSETIQKILGRKQ